MLAAVEIGGTKTQLALMETSGKIVKLLRGRVNKDEGSRGILNWIEENLTQLLEEAPDHVEAIGVGFGGPIQTATGNVLKSVQIEGWSGFPLKKWFEEHFHLPSFIYNDSSAAGYGEYVIGSGNGKKLFFYTNMGTGIGGSLIINGEMFDGQGFGAAELGQLRVPDWTSGERDADTKLENICSGSATEQRLRKQGYVPKESILLQICEGDVSRLTGKMRGEALNAGDAFALEEIDRVAKTMSMALANLLCIMQVERIAIGGGFALIGEPLLEKIRKYTEERAFISNTGRYDIVPCETGEEIVLYGATLLAAKDLDLFRRGGRL